MGVRGVLVDFGGVGKIDEGSVKPVLTDSGFFIRFGFKTTEPDLIDGHGRKCDNNFSVGIYEYCGCLFQSFVGADEIKDSIIVGSDADSARALYNEAVDALLAA